MEYAQMILEYLKVILTAPVLFSIVAALFIEIFKEDIKALMLRIAKIRLPGGTEVDTPQNDQPKVEDVGQKLVQVDEAAIAGLPSTLSQQERTEVENLVRSQRAVAYLWEYRYLNHFFVRRTQVVLDWLIGLPQPTTFAHYDSMWLPSIPSSRERQTIINVLDAHHLIQQSESSLIQVTPKGLEYHDWRGPLPPITYPDK